MMLNVRPAVHHDLIAIHAIYAHHVCNGTGTFEETPPTAEQIEQRWLQREKHSQPTLVAVSDNEIVGFAYAAFYKERSAYRFTVEDSVYVAPEKTGQGVGYALLSALIDNCTRLQYQQMMAVIGDSANHGSIALHRRCGFVHVGTAVGLGYKFGQWLDVVYMQRSLVP